MAHQVEIDRDGIDQAFARFEGGEQAGTVEGEHLLPGEGPQPGPNPWQKNSELVAGFLNMKVFPNWEVPEESLQEWADALAECMEEWFPGGIANIDSWPSWAKLLFATGGLAIHGIDMQTMTLKPLHPVPDEPQEDPPSPGHVQTPQPTRSSDGSFSIGGANDAK